MTERSIHEMLRDSPSMNESSSAIHSGTEAPPALSALPFSGGGGSSQASSNYHNNPSHQKPPSTLRLTSSHNHSMIAASTPPAGSSSSAVTSPGSQNGASTPGSDFLKNGASKIDSLKNWSISTYKCTRQLMLEKLGKTTRTVDLELETQIEQLRDTQRKYLSILRLTRAMGTHFFHMVQTQHALAESFSDLAQKSPELQEEFLYNSETQRNLTKNGEILLSALNFFCSSVSTLCNKTIEDTLITIKQYEVARIEFDAYKMDLETTAKSPAVMGGAAVTSPATTTATTTTSPTSAATTITTTSVSPMADEAQKNYAKHKEQYEKLRADVAVKMQFLDENRIKVMHKQLVLLHNAISAYFSGNAQALESTLKQFNIKVKSPNASTGSWLEK